MMKAKVKATGEIVNVYFRSPLWVNGDTKETYFPKELDTVWVEKREKPSKTIDYWTKLEHQYAGMAMQGILSNPELFKATAKNAEEFGLIVPQAVAIDAYCFARALVQKMKEERK